MKLSAGFCIFMALMVITASFIFALWEITQAVNALADLVTGANL